VTSKVQQAGAEHTTDSSLNLHAAIIRKQTEQCLQLLAVNAATTASATHDRAAPSKYLDESRTDSIATTANLH
jgi:ectoine hydroxylase-related dioxygenase (phytanoyl-CoA dioxygenase family)